MTRPRKSATYDLEWVQYLVESGRYRILLLAASNAQSMGFDESDIVDCVLALDEGDLHKTMPAKKVPGLMQDVYYTNYGGVQIYLKLNIASSSDAVIIQFKRNTSDEL